MQGGKQDMLDHQSTKLSRLAGEPWSAGTLLAGAVADSLPEARFVARICWPVGQLSLSW